MKLSVLVDNHTYIDQYYLGEPAVSYYIEDGNKKILFDAGYSDIFIGNAKKMEIDLKKINTIVFSHGHNDHTGGLQYLTEYMDISAIDVVAHPHCFMEKKVDAEDIGAPFSTEEMESGCKLQLSSQPLQISEHIIFLGEIPSINSFETRKEIGEYKEHHEWKKDTVLDDTALVYQSLKGLFIITGCSHSGICNIITYAKKVCREEKIAGIIGGLHLFEVDDQLQKTIKYFRENELTDIYPCHCVSFLAKAKINETIKVHEVGVGMMLEI